MTWIDDPRPLAECLRAWAAAHGVERYGVAPWLSTSLNRVSLRTVEGWLSGSKPGGAEPVIRLAMTLLDERAPTSGTSSDPL